MNLKLTAAQALAIAKRVIATYIVAFVTAESASNYGWDVATLEKAAVAGIAPVLILLQSLASSWLVGVPQVVATYRLLVHGHSAPKAGVKFGALPARQDTRTLHWHMYLRDLPVPPKVLTWGAKLLNLGMMLNDRLGDCTIAAWGHSVQVWTSNATTQFTIPDPLILQAYSAISGYDPATGANDNGCNELDVLNYMRKTGIDGHKLDAYVSIDPNNSQHLKQAIDLFGVVYIGTAVPAGWEQAPPVWNVLHGAAGKIVGGHAVIVIGWDKDGWLIVSWGQTFHLSTAAMRKYVSEAYGLVSSDWIAANGQSVNGFALPQLLADAAALG